MPCYQSTNLPSGVTTTGRTSHKTEAECNQACKEGACCEGTTCSVKPQCQCKCASGSCCGPDTFTNSNGETGPRCRTETKSQCDARGGTFRCGVGCVNATDEAGGAPRPGIGICLSLASSPSSPVFKGVGTVCSPNPCCECQALVMVQVKLAALLGGSTVTRYGCNGTILADSTQVSWSCSASGCTLSVQNLYSTRFDGICNVSYPSVVGIGKSFSPVVVPLLSSGPCVGVAAVGWPAATTFSRQDFSVLTDIPAFYASVPDHCWGYGRPPSSDPVFPQSIYIGPATPLP
jgi:hypothetical protein